MDVKKIFEKYKIVFCIFIIGSFLGFIIENVWTIIKGHFILRKGLIYSPLIPIYGIGALAFYFIYNNLKFKHEHKIICVLKIFVIGFALGGMTEYFCSYFQEHFFGTVSWEYSKLNFNLNGRTSLFHSFCWGLLGIFFYETILPFFNKRKERLKDKTATILILILSIFVLFDCTISTLACVRQDARRNNIEAKNKMDKYLDRKYTDDYLKKIYNNARVVK